MVASGHIYCRLQTFIIFGEMKTIGQTIRALRRKQEWSQEEVAVRLGMSVPAFSKIETGLTDINLTRLEQIAGIFDMTGIDLLTYGEPPQKPPFERLAATEAELIGLQQKVISLYEELRKLSTPL